MTIQNGSDPASSRHDRGDCQRSPGRSGTKRRLAAAFFMEPRKRPFLMVSARPPPEQIEARLIAARLDPVLDCKCRTELSDCPHVRRQREHALSATAWLALLKLAYPGEYEQPPLARAAAVIRHQASAVEVYRRRLAAGCHLYHPGDVWRSAEALARDVGLGKPAVPAQDAPVPFDEILHAEIMGVLARGRREDSDEPDSDA